MSKRKPKYAKPSHPLSYFGPKKTRYCIICGEKLTNCNWFYCDKCDDARERYGTPDIEGDRTLDWEWYRAEVMLRD